MVHFSKNCLTINLLLGLPQKLVRTTFEDFTLEGATPAVLR